MSSVKRVWLWFELQCHSGKRSKHLHMRLWKVKSSSDLEFLENTVQEWILKKALYVLKPQKGSHQREASVMHIKWTMSKLITHAPTTQLVGHFSPCFPFKVQEWPWSMVRSQSKLYNVGANSSLHFITGKSFSLPERFPNRRNEGEGLITKT